MPDFGLTTEQLQKLNAWISNKKKVYTGAIGGRFEYCFFPTTLGTVVKVKDSVDKTEIDLTNYGEW